MSKTRQCYKESSTKDLIDKYSRISQSVISESFTREADARKSCKGVNISVKKTFDYFWAVNVTQLEETFCNNLCNGSSITVEDDPQFILVDGDFNYLNLNKPYQGVYRKIQKKNIKKYLLNSNFSAKKAVYK